MIKLTVSIVFNMCILYDRLSVLSIYMYMCVADLQLYSVYVYMHSVYRVDSHSV